MTLDQILERARAAAAAGFDVQQRNFGVMGENGECVATEGKGGACGLGLAMIGLAWTGDEEKSEMSEYAEILGVEEWQAADFAAGFDGDEFNPNDEPWEPGESEWYDAGRALALELLPEGE